MGVRRAITRRRVRRHVSSCFKLSKVGSLH
jgi:hypothetical protein